MIKQNQLTIATPGRGTLEITQKIDDVVQSASIETGLCQVFIHHTSASLILCENADPSVRADLETVMLKLAPDGDSMFTHANEGADDMPAHVRTVLTQSHLSIPITHNRCALGTWQGIYIWEHRLAPHHRLITVTVYG